MRRLGLAFFVTGALSAWSGVCAEGVTSSPYVALSAEFSAAPCKSLVVLVGVKDPDGTYATVKTVNIVSRFTGTSTSAPEVNQFEPGEYHITKIDCFWDDNKHAQIGEKANFLGVDYKHSYASFVVVPGKMLDVGRLRVFVGPNNTIGRLDVVDLPAETYAALKRAYPAEYAKMIKRPMIASSSSVGLKINATEWVVKSPYLPRSH